MTNKQKREHLIAMLDALLEVNIQSMSYIKELASDEKSKEICLKSIEQSKLGKQKIREIKHIEILNSLYNHLIYGKEPYFASVGSTCSYERIDIWDKSKKGFQEFISLEQKGYEEAIKKQEEMKKNQEMVAKAKAEGKKVEMIYDNDTKEMRPVIVNEKPNA